MGLDEVAHAEPVHRSENDTHPIVESDTVDPTVNATVPRRSGDHNCVPNPFDPDAACETSVYAGRAGSVPRQFQYCITTAPPTVGARYSAQKSHKERHDLSKGVKAVSQGVSLQKERLVVRRN